MDPERKGRRTDVVDEHRAPLHEGEDRLFRQAGFVWELRCGACVSGLGSGFGYRDKPPTALFAIFITTLFGSSKFSIPSLTRSCCACALMGPGFSFRGILALFVFFVFVVV